MTTITQVKKKSLLLWVVIIALFAAVIIVGVLSYMGYISLQFVADALVGYAAFGSQSWINAVLIIAGPVALGAFGYWTIKKYFIGEKVITNQGTAQGYAPAPSYPTQPAQSGTETKIS